MMENYDYRLPRLFIETDLAENTTIPLGEDSAHYLKNVLRRPEGSQLRVFNGRDGEFLVNFTALDRKKYNLNVQNLIRHQSETKKEIHLVFALIKKDRQDFMIEKAVELGATHFHPILTQQTAIRDVNETRIKKQIQEAAEQCERLDIPQLLPLQKLENVLRLWPENFQLFAAVERSGADHLSHMWSAGCGLLIGPEGGFSDQEKGLLLKNPKVTSVNLGPRILRAETAAIFGLSLLTAPY